MLISICPYTLINLNCTYCFILITEIIITAFHIIVITSLAQSLINQSMIFISGNMAHKNTRQDKTDRY